LDINALVLLTCRTCCGLTENITTAARTNLCRRTPPRHRASFPAWLVGSVEISAHFPARYTKQRMPACNTPSPACDPALLQSDAVKPHITGGDCGYAD